jgi:hypothetical protein
MANPPTSIPTIVHGRHLALGLHRLSASQRALLAFELTTGAVTLCGLTRKQAARIAGANTDYVSRVAHISDSEREQLRGGGLRLSKTHPRQPRELSDAEIDHLVRTVGPDRVMAAIDRLTAPEFQFAAAE